MTTPITLEQAELALDGLGRDDLYHYYNKYNQPALSAVEQYITQQAERLRVVTDALQGMVRLSNMDLDDSLIEPEENGNYVAYNKAIAALAAQREG